MNTNKMAAVSRIFTYEVKQKFQVFQSLRALIKDINKYSTAAKNAESENDENPRRTRRFYTDSKFTNYRFIYQDFLPDPNPLNRNWIREKLERKDMVTRRTQVEIPEFYVGSILSVVYSDPHAAEKTNKFVGLCIERKGCGLKANFNLRNVVDNQGVEMVFNLYDPCIIQIVCLRLEKRLDDSLRYLRDAPNEYCTIPFDMEPEYLQPGTPVPVNEMKVALKPPPYNEKYWLHEYKGISNLEVRPRAYNRWQKHRNYLEKYDLMKMYRETIPEEEQNQIFTEVYKDLNKMEAHQRKQTRARMFSRKKTK